MLALVTLGFSKMVEESLSKMNSNLLNEGLIKTCGDAWWDDGRFDHERKDLQFYIPDFIKRVKAIGRRDLSFEPVKGSRELASIFDF